VVATIFPTLLTLIQFDTFTPFLIVGVGLTSAQFLIGNVIEPKLMASSLNLSPLVVLLSLALWGSLWGIPGMFLCVPITVILLIVLSHFDTTRPLAVTLSERGELAEEGRG
jgi:predicted PurR-regulated permease PerM